MPDQRADGPGRAESGPAPRWHRYAVPALLLIHAAACWLARPIGYLTGQDDIEYVVLGQSLRDFGYNVLFRVDLPVHAQYPPGYPAMLAIWGAIGGDGFDWLALLNLLLSVALLLVTYVATRRVFDDRVALAALAVLALNPGLVAAGGNVASEAPFTLLSMASLLLLLSEKRGARYAGWAGAVAILAALTRSVGILLIGAIGLHWLIERRWKRLLLLAGASLALVGAWMLWTFVSPEQHVGSSYVADLQAAVSRAAVGASFLTRAWNRFTFYASRGGPHTLAVPTVAGTPIDNVISTAILVAGLAIGCWLLLRRWRPAGLLVLGYGAFLLAWTYRSDRFLVPLLPIIVPALLAGISVPFARRWPRAAGAAVVVAAVLLMGGGAVQTGSTIAQRSGCRNRDLPPTECVTPDQASFFAAVRYIRDTVPAEDVFLVAKPGALWYYAGNQSISYPAALAQGPDGWVPYLKERGVRWILLADLEYGEPLRYSRRIEANCERLALVRRFPERTYLFRLIDDNRPADDSREGAGEACEAVREYRNATAETTTSP